MAPLAPTRARLIQEHVKNIFTTLNYVEEFKVDQAAFYLSETAGIWWTGVKGEMRDERTFGTENGPRGIILSRNLRRAKRIKFDNVKQGRSTAQEYFLKLQELSQFCAEDIFTESSKALKFEQHLDIEIRVKLAGFEMDTLTTIYLRACNIERVPNEKKAITGEKRKRAPSESTPNFQEKRHSN
ncbi:hypothetical protein RND81_07G041200 [Saponaria officinalis]|uniref:Retrotransposon gag domain-containing protein n=1 Tax=Saponaria officinalis TaxID=3572 RepID=A0AAW1JMR4_SAPOF